MNFFTKLQKTVFPDTQEITEEIILHYEKNPDELDLIIDREQFHAAYLSLFFALGIITTVSARLVQYFYGEILGDFVNTVILDVISELGIAIFGGAVVAYLIEYLNKQQFKQNVQFRRDVISILEQRKKGRKS